MRSVALALLAMTACMISGCTAGGGSGPDGNGGEWNGDLPDLPTLANQAKAKWQLLQLSHAMLQGPHVIANLTHVIRILLDRPRIDFIQQEIREVGLRALDS